MKRLFLLLSILSLTAQDAPPASIHLDLGKDTLALAEPTFLTVEIHNQSETDLPISDLFMFGLEESPPNLSLFLITPEGEEWEYIGRRYSVFATYSINDSLYLSLPPGWKVSRNMFVWWTGWVPNEYKTALEKLPPGTYKMFAIYAIDEFAKTHEGKFLSDTIEFVFLPLEERNLQALIEMDSLIRFFHSVGAAKGRAGLNRILSMDTPYREATDALLITWIKNYDSLTTRKTKFDKLYPRSQFTPMLLKYQLRAAERDKLTLKADSLFEVWAAETPTSADVLTRQKKIGHLTAKAVVERFKK